MGNCLQVEVREQSFPYRDRKGRPRHVVVREKNQSAYRTSEETLYRPRSRLTIRHDDYRSQEDSRSFDDRQNNYGDYYAPQGQTNYRNDRPFQPLPPQAPRTPMIHNQPFRNNNPHDQGMIDYGHQPNHHDEIQVIDDNPIEIIPRSPRSDRGRRQMAGPSSRRGGSGRRYHDGSDDGSWGQRRSRSRNNGGYYH